MLALPRHQAARLGAGLAVAGVAAVIAIAGFAGGGAGAAPGTVHTNHGGSLTLRAKPTTHSSAVTYIPSGRRINITCQISGQRVSGKYGTSTLWDKTSFNGHTGYVSDTYVYTGSDGRVAPTCGKASNPPSTTECSTSGTGDHRSCAQAVAWAKAHLTSSYHRDYYRRCDHIMGLAYGWSASGSTTAYVHWTQIPARYKHAGSRNVPAGALAFFSTGSAGHVMISLGGGVFASNDIHGSGTFTRTTIHEIESRWGSHYLGWAQPWFTSTTELVAAR
jgi:uncharacterized protein YraI